MKNKLIRYGTLIVFFGILFGTVFNLRPFGAPTSTEMDDYFIQNGQIQTGANSIVSSILFDYRGLDTLGEATVLFAAATGVWLVFRRRNK